MLNIYIFPRGPHQAPPSRQFLGMVQGDLVVGFELCKDKDGEFCPRQPDHRP